MFRVERAPALVNDPRVMLNRRDVLRLGAAGGAALAALGMAPRVGRADTQTPDATQGPFWVDERLNRQDIRSDPTTGVVQAGLPMRLNVNVSRLTGTVATALPNAWVDIWHAGAAGSYSDASGAGNPNTIGQKWLRGYQVTDAHGNARFLTVYPGWYIGRTVHIHARVRVFTGATATTNFTTQFFASDAASSTIFGRLAGTYGHGGTRTLNGTDMVYNELASGVAKGSQLMLRMADDSSHVIGSFNIKLVVAGGLTRCFSHADTELCSKDDHAHDFGGGTPSQALRKLLEC